VRSSVGLRRYLISSLAAGGSPRCPSVVILILFQHWPSRLLGLQYGCLAFRSVSHWVNIPVSALGRGLPIILSSCALHSRHAGNQHLVVVSTVSRCHSVTVSRDAVWETIWYVRRSFSVSFGTALVNIITLVRHRSSSLDLLIISPVLV